MIIREKTVNDYLTVAKFGEFSINPYVGCAHSCKYCYASFMKRFTHHPEAWGEFLDVKHCDKPINLKRIEGKNVFMSTVTDCYNDFEEEFRITRSILEQLVNADCYLQIVTKNKLVLRDLDLLKRIRHLSVAISVNTLNEKFRSDMDYASTIHERLETLRELHDNGIYTVLFMSPIFIRLTDWKAIIEMTQDFVSEYWFEVLNLRGSFKSTILNYIKTHYPDIYPTYECIYQKGQKEELYAMEHDILSYCNTHGIIYSDYFHHEKVVKEEKHQIIGKNR